MAEEIVYRQVEPTFKAERVGADSWMVTERRSGYGTILSDSQFKERYEPIPKPTEVVNPDGEVIGTVSMAGRRW